MGKRRLTPKEIAARAAKAARQHRWYLRTIAGRKAIPIPVDMKWDGQIVEVLPGVQITRVEITDRARLEDCLVQSKRLQQWEVDDTATLNSAIVAAVLEVIISRRSKTGV